MCLSLAFYLAWAIKRFLECYDYYISATLPTKTLKLPSYLFVPDAMRYDQS